MTIEAESSPGRIFAIFLKLGCVAFGGPIAHLGFFQKEFVSKRKWLTEQAYADLVALCQFLPGPASSQVGFALGLKAGGIRGAFAAWIGFTLPSAILMFGFALGLGFMGDIATIGWVTGLKLAAVAVVADAIWSMAVKLCPDPSRAIIALGCAAMLVLLDDPYAQVIAIAIGLLLGFFLFIKTVQPKNPAPTTSKKTSSWPYLFAFIGLLIGLPALASFSPDSWVAVGAAFYKAGSLVFGGGHVVLPLLEASTVGPGWISENAFLAGYGAAQALPGPLFAYSAFLGTELSVGPGGIIGGVLALVAIYLPAWLLVLGAMPYWDRLRNLSGVQAALMGANAAVVGLLIAAFYNPIWAVAVTDSGRFAFALIAFATLRFLPCPPWLLVFLCGIIGAIVF